jgi:trigger factor
LTITLDKKSTNEGRLKVSLRPDDYRTQVDKKLKDYARKANIKGFRQGHVPAGVIRKMFGKSILADEINHLLSHKINDYIRENKLRVLGDPLPDTQKANSIDWETQTDFEFEYLVGLVEDFRYDLSSKVKVKNYVIEVSETSVQETLADLRNRFGATEQPEVCESGDNLMGELSKADGSWKNTVYLMTSRVNEKLRNKFVGLKKEDSVEFEPSAAFDEEYLKAMLGKEGPDGEGSFTFRVTEISRIVPSQINQELFDRVFGKDAVTSEEAFLEKIRATIAENYGRETDHFLAHTIEDHFLKETKINLPDEFLKTWLKASGGGQITDQVLDLEFEDYKRGLKWDLIKNRMTEDHKIEVAADEVKDRARKLIIDQFGGPRIAEQLADRLDAIVDNYLTNENGKNFTRLYSMVRNEKIIALIRQTITLKEERVTLEEFRKVVQEHKH